MSAIAINTVFVCILNPSALSSPWELWLPCITMPLVSCCLGYVLAAIFKMPAASCRTIAMETSAQGVATTIAVIMTSFPRHQAVQMQTIPSFYSACNIINCSIMTVIFVAVKKHRSKCELTNENCSPEDAKNFSTTLVKVTDLK